MKPYTLTIRDLIYKVLYQSTNYTGVIPKQGDVFALNGKGYIVDERTIDKDTRTITLYIEEI